MKTDANEALNLIEKHTKTLKTEYVNISEALGRVVSEDMYALNDYPPFSRSPYDGYAIRAEDRKNREIFTVIGSSFAGTPFMGTVGRNEAVKIMTGGVIPPGADCVVPWEKTDRGEEKVSIYAEPRPYENYIKQGEDYKRGELLLKKDIVMNAAEMALAVSGGVSEIEAYPVLKAAVISTGDEIVPPGEKLKEGKIYDTNMIYVSSRLKELKVDTVYVKAAPDDVRLLNKTFTEACKSSDIVFTTGGVSAGQKDLVPQVLENMGAEIIFKGVDIKPGMPTVFSMAQNGVPVVSLSGNPFAAAVGFELFGRAALAKRSGNRFFLPKRSDAVLKSGYSKKGGAERYVKAFESNGYVDIPSSQGNGSLRSMCGCNCLVRIPKEIDSLSPGERVEILYV